MPDLLPCSLCQKLTSPAELAEAHQYAFWHKTEGACPACVQQALLYTLLDQGDRALHERIQAEWPLDAEAAFGALPTPPHIRQILQQSATPIPGVPRQRQGAGALEAGTAVALAQHKQHDRLTDYLQLPHLGDRRITFILHDHRAHRVRLFGSWDGWAGQVMSETQAGVWEVERPLLPPGSYEYKYLLDENRWLDDPANPSKSPDGSGGFNSLLTIKRINDKLRVFV